MASPRDVAIQILRDLDEAYEHEEIDIIERHIRQSVAEEREACAKLCEEWDQYDCMGWSVQGALERHADKIRERRSS